MLAALALLAVRGIG